MNIDDTNLENDVSPEAKLLRQYIAQAKDIALKDVSRRDDDEPAGSLIYLGNPQTAVPDRLLLATELDSDQKILWCLLRMQVQQSSRPASTPRQADLSRTLGMARSTIMVKLMGLRLFRWITRCAEIRCPTSGRFIGLIESIHDQPLPLNDTLYLDPDYIDWVTGVTQKTSNNYRQLRSQARLALKRVDHEAGNSKTSAISIAHDQLLIMGSDDPDNPCSIIDHGQNHRDQLLITGLEEDLAQKSPCSIIDHGQNHHDQLLITGKKTEKDSFQPTIGNKSSSCSNNKTTTTTKTKDKQLGREPEALETEIVYPQTPASPLRFPPSMTQSERQLAEKRILQNLPPPDQQYLLDYLRDRMADQTQHPVENRLAYLKKLAQSHLAGTLEPSSYGLKQPAAQRSQTTESAATEEDAQAAWERQMRHLMGDAAEDFITRSKLAAGRKER